MARRKPIRREAIIEVLSKQRRALHVNELGTRLGLEDHERFPLRDALEQLVSLGVVAPLAGQRYRLNQRAAEPRGRQVEGVLQVNPRGFGFVHGPPDGQDLFVPGESFGGAMHGDRVRSRVVSRSSRGLEGEVLEVVERANQRVAGVLHLRRASCWLEPDDGRVRGPIVLPAVRGRATSKRKRSSAEPASAPPDALPPADGLAAVIEITRYPDHPDEHPEGRILAVLGVPGQPTTEVQKLLLIAGVNEEHPAAAMAEVAELDGQLEPEVLAGREDLTDVPLVTIDPIDARDHDDAVYAERLDDGSYRAWVAIADVSHYVRPGSALDEAARSRGHSVYLPDRAIPMLPHALSAGLCSLVPGELRLCMCVVLDLRPTGTVRRFRLVEGIMRSRAKLSYAGVARALGFTMDGVREVEAERRRDELRVLWDLAMVLRQRRMRRGALDLDVPETHVTVDADSGAPVAVARRGHDPGIRKSYRLIEELMLLANETCARHLVRADLPGVFRVHAAPDPDKLDRFAAMAGELGLESKAAAILEAADDPKLLSRFLRSVGNHPKAGLLHGLLLRAMQQAAYDTVNIGHYGLASGAYLHFSSPIRRYPDLLVHRVLRAAIGGQAVDDEEIAPPVVDEQPAEAESPLRAAAMAASRRERAIMSVERQIVDLYRAIYMRRHLGDRFEGTVAAVTSGALFVRLDDPFVDVLVPMDGLGNDSYEMDEVGLRAVGRRSGERVELGDTLLVQIEDVSLVRRAVYGRRIVARRPDRDSQAGHGSATRQRGKRRQARTMAAEARERRKGRGRAPKGRGRGRKRNRSS